MRRGRSPSRSPSRPRRPVWDNPRGQLPGTGIRSDAENLYSGNLYRGSAPGASGTSSGSAAVAGESSFGGRSLPVNVLGSGSGGASSGPVFNPFAAAMASLGPVERYESQYMGASEFLNRRVNEELQRADLFHSSSGKSREELYALLFDRAARGSRKNPCEEKAYRGPALKAVQTWWEQCKDWMLYFKGQSAPLVMDFHGLLQAFRGKEEGARAEVEAFMEHCAKRWQTKEGTYQLKRRRLLPDVRDPPEQGNADVDMRHLNFTWMAWRITTWWKRCFEGLRGARLFHLVSLFFCEFSLDVACWLFLCVVGWFLVFCCCCFGLLCFFQWKFCIQLAFQFFRISSCWPTMSRTRSAMQEKKTFFLVEVSGSCLNLLLRVSTLRPLILPPLRSVFEVFSNCFLWWLSRLASL